MLWVGRGAMPYIDGNLLVLTVANVRHRMLGTASLYETRSLGPASLLPPSVLFTGKLKHLGVTLFQAPAKTA
jgi:hypothetical protein